jgi:superfamily II DNA/RNA helicase
MPDDSFFRIEDLDKRERLLPILHKLYEFESERISGSHGGFRRFSESKWTKEQAVNWISQKYNLDINDVNLRMEELIQEMSDLEKRHMLKFKIGDTFYHITRIAEMIRTTGNLHEYQNREVLGQDPKKYRIIEGTRWEPRLRYTARREISKQDLLNRVSSSFTNPNHRLPPEMGSLPLGTAMEDLERVLDAIENISKFNGNLRFTEFQAEAIVTAFQQSWSLDTNSSMVITAGTGMGKTLGFAIPVIVDALISNRAEGRVCSQLLMYPRNSLAKDQFAEIEGYVKQVNNSLIRSDEKERCIGIAIDADGLLKKKKDSFPGTLKDKPQWNVGGKNVYDSASEIYGKDKPASIIACSIESFRRRLKYPEVSLGLKRGLRRIVFDEVHLSSGTQGAHHSKLISRCRQIIFDLDFWINHRRSKNLNFIGVSATIAKPKSHVGKISSQSAINVTHVNASSEETISNSPLGILHHIMIRPRAGTPTNGALVDITSSVTHQRRSRDFYVRGTGVYTGSKLMKNLQKTIGFADSHEVVGNWHSLLIDNESTGRDRRRTVNGTERVRRPYAHWHERPLRIHDDGEEVCRSCQRMEHHPTPINISRDDVAKFREFTGGSLNGEYSSWNLPIYEQSEDENFQVTGLETCPHLDVGTCWWFSPREETFEDRPDDPGNLSFEQVIRSSRYTGKTKPENEDEEGSQSANYAFKQDPRRNAYERGQIQGEIPISNPIPHDIAIATPTLEVGVDMDNVSEVITHKAIRNISSYRQKVGRAGREPGTDAVAMTLMSMAGNTDFQHYRSMNRLIDTDIADPVPIALNNLAVKKNEAYDAVYDYLAKNGYDIELIPKLKQQKPGDSEYNRWNEMGEKIRNAIKFICQVDAEGNPIDIQTKCDKHLEFAVGVGKEIRKKAAITAAEHLNLFLERTQQGSLVIQWLAARKAGQKLKAPLPGNNAKIWIDIDDQYNKVKKMESENEYVISCRNRIKDAIENQDVKKLQEECEKLFNLDNDFEHQILGHRANQLEEQEPEHPLCREIASLDKGRRHYLSSIMEECSAFHKDTPFAPLSSLFENPYEEPVIVTRYGEYNNTDMITNKEALTYTLPGMWTHRLFKGQRYFVKHDGDVILSDDGTFFHMSLEENDIQHVGQLNTSEVTKFPNILDLSPTENIDIYKIISLEVSSDKGSMNMSNRIDGGAGDYEGLFKNTFGNGDVLEGGVANLMRPKAYSISWVLSEFSKEKDEANQINTYLVKETKPSTANSHESFPVTLHPLLNTIFEKIIYDEKMKTKRVALGVSRSNGPILAPSINHRKIALVDQIETKGIRFYIKKEFIDESNIIGENSEHPFDEQILRMIGSWILSRNDTFRTNSYRVNEYLDILVEESWRLSNTDVKSEEFPKTNGDFINLIFRSGKSFDPQVFQRRAEHSSVTADDQLQDMVYELTELHDRFTTHYQDFAERFEENMSEWYRSTLLNTLGLLIAEGIGEMAGVQTGSIGYTYNDNDNEYWIDVFDDDAEGNGSVELAKDYFHIPTEVRDLAEHFADRNLPSSSFVEILERRMQTCQEHILHEISVSNKSPPKRTPTWMLGEAMEIRQRFGKEWKNLGISDTREANLHSKRIFSLDLNNQSERLDFEMALSLCSSECPSCSGNSFTNILPPHLVKFGTCRSVLDRFLGDWTQKKGYLKQFGDRKRLSQISGNNVGSGKFIDIKSNENGALGSRKHFVQYPSPPISYFWIRNMSIPDEIDFIVRHLEIL